MQFSHNFLREFIEIKESPQELAKLLTMAGLEIEHLEKKDRDYIYTAEVTSNRYDWLSIFGIAYEISALCNKRLKIKFPKILDKPLLAGLKIKIEDYKDCPLYTARLLRGVKIKDSPQWLKYRLINCGLNTINNIVDITNYCMLRWGNPLHAFDKDKIEGNIEIRRAKEGEEFLGLDGKLRRLTRDNLVISDSKKVIALAGVMGSKLAEVDSNTRDVLLEAAVFSPSTIRRSRRSVGIETDSSYRFERNVSFHLLEIASSEAVKLMQDLGEGRFGGYKRVGGASKYQKRIISFSLRELNGYIGEHFSFLTVKRILSNLGFSILESNKDKIKLSPSFFRLDIEEKVDIFEEIARIYGYDKIKEELPSFIIQKRRDEMYEFKRALRDFLISLGLTEAITYSITAKETLAMLKEEGMIELVNPLRSQENTLRTTFLPGMISIVRYNLNQGNEDLKFFEIANLYHRQGDSFKESTFLGVGVSEKNGFFYLKAVTEALLKFINVKGYKFEPRSYDNFYNALDIYGEDKLLGFMGKLNDALRDKLKLTANLYFMELNIERLKKMKKEITYHSFSRYPYVYRDVSIAVREDIQFKDVEEIIRDGGGKYLKDYRLIDIYQPKEEEKIKYLTLRIFYHSYQRTLTTQEVDNIHFKLREKLAQKEGIILR